jgi:putative PIN family toxin of toxin-antitoxin system
MRVVLDTDVLVAALRSDRGASRQLLQAALRKQIVLLLSVPLVIEYEAVLTRPEQLEVIGATSEEIGAILDALVAVAEPVRLSFRWRPALADPADDMVLETAVNGTADLLVTFNRRDFTAAQPLFQLGLVSPGEALIRLRE